MAASGGIPPYSWSVITGAPPSGVTLTTAGVLGGTPGAAGAFNFTIQVKDSSTSPPVSKAFSLTIDPALTITTPSLPNGNTGAAYSQTLSASGGVTPYSWFLAGGTLPNGLALSSSGVVSGTPSATGSYDINIQVTDFGEKTATKGFTIVITLPPLQTNTPSPLPNGTAGVPYSQTLSASGGTTPYAWSLTIGALPTGLTFTTAGALTGTPTVTGTWNFTVQVTDSAGPPASVSKGYALTISPPPLSLDSPSPLPTGTVGASYSQTMSASGGTAPYSWSVTSGKLPTGLALTSAGILSGTPTANATSSFTIKVTDSAANQAGVSKAFTLKIDPAPVTITSATPMPAGTASASYSQNFAAAGGVGPYTWTVLSGALPSGLTLNSSGTLTGTPGTPGSFAFTIQVTDSGSPAAQSSKSFALSINPFITITTASPLPPGSAGKPYSQTMSVSGGTAPFFWTVTSGALPPGLTLGSTGGISGTPSVAGTFNFSIQVADSAGASATSPFSIDINSALTITSKSSLPSGASGGNYSQALSAFGGTPPYSWTLSAGSLPLGITLTSGGVLSGTPLSSGNSTFTIQVSDSAGGTAGRQFSLTIDLALAIGSSNPLPGGTAGKDYSQSLAAIGGVTPYSWSIFTGTLPAGLSLSATGLLSGTPTTGGSSVFTLQVSDGSGAIANKLVSLTIVPALSVANVNPLPAGTVGVIYSQGLGASGGTSPYSWSLLSGSLPTGIALNAASLGGTPAAAGTFTFTIQVADSAGATAGKALSITITSGLSITTKTLLPSAIIGTPYSQPLTATGGASPYAWSLTSGKLPPGLSILPSGAISGTATAAGSSNFTVQVKDNTGVTSSVDMILAVNLPLSITTNPTLTPASVGTPYSRILSATGGVEPYSWSIASGAAPAGLALDASSGTVNGTPSAAGTSGFTVQVKDGGGNTASGDFSLVTYAGLVITSSSPLPSGRPGVLYSQSLAASGGLAPYRWALASGALPDGLSLDASGTIAGKPVLAGPYSFALQVKDALGIAAVKACALSIGTPLEVAPLSLSFTASVSGAPAPSQNITISSSSAGIPVTISTNTSRGGPWLQAALSRATMPAVVAVSADSRGLAPGDYDGIIAITGQGTDPGTRTVAVHLNVEPGRAPSLQVSSAVLNFGATQGLAPGGQTIGVSSSNGPLAFRASAGTARGGSWLSVSPASGAVTETSPATLLVSTDSSRLAAGTYTGHLDFESPGAAGSAGVTVVLSIGEAGQSLVLSQTGLTFTAVSGSGISLSRNFGVLNEGGGPMNWSVSTSGESWLGATPSTGETDAGGPVPLSTVSVDPSGLEPGHYYGQVAVAAPGAKNSPQSVSVVLNVVPAANNPGPLVSPGGVLFIGNAGGASPPRQNLTLTNLGTTSVTYLSIGASWLSYSPGQGSLEAGAAAQVGVQPVIAGLAPGVHEGTITLQFADGSFRVVTVILVLRGAPSSASEAGFGKVRAVVGCSPTKLVPLFTSVGVDFAVPAGWPNALEMIVVDDCGEFLTTGTVVSSFSNGDPPLAMTSLREGNWAGTWVPRGAGASNVTLTGTSRSRDGKIQGVSKVTGGVRANPDPPVVTPHGIVSAASFAQQSPLAPGSMIAIFGNKLADRLVLASSTPLPTELSQTQVLMAGQQLPLTFVSESQINAIVPYDMPVNARQQVLVRRGPSYTVPESVTLAAAQPSVFTKDASGKGQGIVVDANFRFVDAGNSAKAGDVIIIYCAGLGEVTPKVAAGTPAPTDTLTALVNPVTVTIGEVAAPQVLFAGLAPGFTGLYQVNVVVPQGVPPGDAVTVMLSVADQAGPTVTIAVR